MRIPSGKSAFYAGNRNIYYPKKLSDRLLYLKRKVASDYRFYGKFPLRRHIYQCMFQWKHRIKDFMQKKETTGRADVLLVCVPKHATDSPPLGLAQLKGYLQKEGIESKCLDFNIRLSQEADPYLFNIRDHRLFLDEAVFKQFCEEYYFYVMNNWVEEILSHNPKFIGFSLISQGSMPTAMYLAKAIKKLRSHITVLMGGPQCKKLLSEPIEQGYADIVVLGEGYDSLSQIVKGTDLDLIGDIIYKKNGEIVSSPKKLAMTDLDELPFADFSDFDLNAYSNSGMVFKGVRLPINASLGCTRNCTFCTYSFFMNKFRVRSAKSVFNEMKHQKYRHGTCRFNFMDGMINADMEFIEELCDLIIESGEILYWAAQFGFKEEVTPGLIAKMSMAGCMFLSIGLESGSEKIREDMLKPCSDQKVDELIMTLYKERIPFNLNFLVGYPTETEEDFQKSIALIKRYHTLITTITTYSGVILSGTILSKIAIKNKEYEYHPKKVSEWSYHENTPKLRERRMQQITDIASFYNLIPKTKSGMF